MTETWVELIARNGNLVAIVAGLVGAVIAHAIASRFELNNGFRLVVAGAGFAALFIAGRSALGQRGESRLRNTLIEDAMFSRPDFRKIAEKDPGFRTRVRAFLDSLPAGASLDGVRERVVNWTRDNATTPPLWKYAGVATDSTGAALASLFESALRELEPHPVACVSFLNRALLSRLPSELSSGLETRFNELAVRAAEEGRRSPQPRVDSLTALPLGQMMVRRLRQSHGEQRAREIHTLLSNPTRGDPREVCAAATQLYTAIAALPSPKDGKLMRFMLDRQPVARGRGGASF
jgi:uncharacterized membrane protein YeaQ/YmgE (transglycosylase-associated protein family)